MSVILIADDHPLFRRALVMAVVECLPGARTVEAASLAQARDVLATSVNAIDLVLLDLHMPDSHGLMGLASLRTQFPAVAVAMISAHEDPRTVRRALAFGAMGFIPKSVAPEVLSEALSTILDCRDWLPMPLRSAVAALPASNDDAVARQLAALTPQQHRVLVQVADGRLNKQIADSLGIQERTVKAHLTAIFERLGVRNRTQAGVLLRSLDLADPARAISD